jgi:MFS family permease
MNKNFVLLWQGQFVSQLGSQAFTVAMMFWLKHVTGSASAMGIILMASMLPMVILGPIGGTLADQVSRRRIIIFTDLASGVGVILFALVMFLAPDATDLLLVLLFVVAVGGGVLRAFFSPAISAAIPSIVPDEKVAAANSLNQSSTEVSTLIGQGIGGVLFRLLGAPVLFLIDGITYVFSAVSETFIEIPQTLPEERLTWRDAGRRVMADLRAGISHVTARRGLRDFMIAAAVINFFSMPFFVLLPFHVEDTLGSTPDWFGYMLAGFGAGGIVGYAAAGTLRTTGRSRGAIMALCLVGLAACMTALGVAPTVGTSLALMIVAGVFHGYFQVGIMTILQLSTPEDMRGRVFGVLQTLVMGLTPISMGLAGVAADLVDQNTRLLFTVCGGVLFVTAVVVAFDPPLRGYLAYETESKRDDADL